MSIKMADRGNTMDNKLYNEKASSQAVAHDLTKGFILLIQSLFAKFKSFPCPNS